MRIMDAPLRAAVAAAGGRAPFFRALGMKGRPAWRRVPQDRVFDVARVTGLEPEQLRPDLADWIALEGERRAEAAQRQARIAAARRSPPLVVDAGLVDLTWCLGAMRFVGARRGLSAGEVHHGGGRPAQAARSYAMALAKVVGRARSVAIAGVFGCARQNVDNATERYLRARDGDDPDEFLLGPDGEARVLARDVNRLRRAKAADETLWDVEAEFEAFIAGEAPAEPERKRA